MNNKSSTCSNSQLLIILSKRVRRNWNNKCETLGLFCVEITLNIKPLKHLWLRSEVLSYWHEPSSRLIFFSMEIRGIFHSQSATETECSLSPCVKYAPSCAQWRYVLENAVRWGGRYWEAWWDTLSKTFLTLWKHYSCVLKCDWLHLSVSWYFWEYELWCVCFYYPTILTLPSIISETFEYPPLKRIKCALIGPLSSH